MATLISDKIHFKVENIIRNKGHDKMINGPVQEKGIAVVNIYSFNIGTPQYIRQRVTNIRWEIDSSTIIVGDFINQ